MFQDKYLDRLIKSGTLDPLKVCLKLLPRMKQKISEIFFTKIGIMKITGILDQLDKIFKIDKNNLVPVLRLGRPSNQRLE